jgi:hypothetical protein
VYDKLQAAKVVCIGTCNFMNHKHCAVLFVFIISSSVRVFLKQPFLLSRYRSSTYTGCAVHGSVLY